jgi:ADP-heptose:LPS heptosyltransferase
VNAHVLVCRLDSDGDVLLAGPAVRAVAAGAGRVTLLCGPRGRAAAELLPGVDEVLEFRCPWIDPEPGPVDSDELLALAAELRGRVIDRAIVLTSFHQSALPTALLLRLAGIPTIAAVSEDYPGSLLDVRHRVPDELHEVERSLSLVATLGYRLPAGDPGRLAIRPGERRSPVAPDHGPFVVVHPGASVPARAWAPERSAELVDALVAAGHRVVVTGGTDERTLTRFVAGEGRPEVIDLGGRTDLSGLAAVLAQADAVVVGNTGPAHVAAAVGTPVVSLFAPVLPAARWRPWRVPHVLLGDQAAACRDSRARVCPLPGHPCLNGIAVEAVVEAVQLLARPSLVAATA